MGSEMCIRDRAWASKNSTERLRANSQNKTQTSTVEKTNARLQRVVHMIILTDFVCWIPFVITCWLHFLSIVDAKPWYPTFSILVLPINSVVNPLLYNKSITETIDSLFVRLKTKITNLILSFRKKASDIVIRSPGIELEEGTDQIQAQENEE